MKSERRVNAGRHDNWKRMNNPKSGLRRGSTGNLQFIVAADRGTDIHLNGVAP